MAAGMDRRGGRLARGSRPERGGRPARGEGPAWVMQDCEDRPARRRITEDLLGQICQHQQNSQFPVRKMLDFQHFFDFL